MELGAILDREVEREVGRETKNLEIEYLPLSFSLETGKGKVSTVRPKKKIKKYKLLSGKQYHCFSPKM